jgi:hypothetical protein
MPPIEILLPLGAVGFYVLDSILWLYGNEVVFVRKGGRWRHQTGSDWLLFGRRIYLPNPLTPNVPIWRACWSEGVRSGPVTNLMVLEEDLRKIWPLRVIVVALMVLIVVGLPVVLVTLGQGLVLVCLFLAAYTLAAMGVGWLWWRRRRLGLSNRVCLRLTIDALACPPFAVNLVRKLSLLRELKGDALEVARPAFEPPCMDALRATLKKVVNDELAAEPEGTARYQKLVTYLDGLQERTGCH